MSGRDPDDNDLIGRALSDGRYVIERLIGAGGMGAVYLGHQRAVNRKVAIKVIHGDLSKTANLRARFIREAQALAGLQTPHCVTVHDFGETDDGLLYIVMEHLTGRNLADRLARDGRLPLELFMGFMRQICSAVHAAHSAGLVHRDLKPENIFLQESPDGPQIKILDFGLVKLLEPSDEGEDETSLTRPGQVFGTPMYMSPEQVLGQEVDGRADLYAMGLIAYECLTGQPAFAAPTPRELLMAHVSREPPKLEYLRSDAPSQVVNAIGVCLSKPADERYDSALEFLAAMEAQADTCPVEETEDALTLSMSDTPVPIPSTPPPPASTDRDQPRIGDASRKSPAWYLGALTAAVLCALWLWPPSSDPDNGSPAASASPSCTDQPAPAYGPSGAPCRDEDTLYTWSFHKGFDGLGPEQRPFQCRPQVPEAVTIQGAPEPLTKMAAFSGATKSRIECQAPIALSPPFTVEAWVRPRLTPDLSCHQAVIGTGKVRGGGGVFRCTKPRLLGGWVLTLYRQGEGFFAVDFRSPPVAPPSSRSSSPSLRSNLQISADRWSHLAVVNDGHRLTLVVNGQSTTGPAPGPGRNRAGFTLTMGGYPNAVDGLFAGDLAGLRISSTARDPKAIKTAYRRARALLP